MDIISVAIANQHYQDINPRICGAESCVPSHSYGPTERDYWLLHYVISGEGFFRIRGETYPVRPSQIFVIPPGELTYYEADSENPWKYIWIGFESGVELPSVLEQPVIPLPQGRALFESLLDANEMEQGKEVYLCGKIWELLYLLFTSGENTSRRELYVRQAKNYIESEYMTGITVSSLAARLGLDRSYFSGVFRQETGKAPRQYLNEVRMQKAADQLLNHGYTVTETAISVGYPDVFAFSRMFRNYFGMSPREYREKNKS